MRRPWRALAPLAAALDYAGQLAGPTAVGGSETYLVQIGPAADGLTGITLQEGGRTRILGTYEAVTGNPVIMYFLESTLRQMADVSGGSPFYIRNRIKEALLEDAEIVPAEFDLGGQIIAAEQVTIHPFANDAARNRMGDFADLTLSVTVGEAIPGWYGKLAAFTSPDGDEAYSNTLTLTGAGPEGTPQ